MTETTTIEARIAALLAEAAPLRDLDDDDQAKDRLGPIVDMINALRARQAAGEVPPPAATPVEGEDAAADAADAPRRRGRPPKTTDGAA